MLIIYELKKLWGHRVLQCIFLIALVGHAILCCLSFSDGQHEVPKTIVDPFFVWRETNPIEYETSYAQVMTMLERQDEEVLEQLRNGNFSYKPEPLPVLYAPDGYTDAEVFGVVQSYLLRIDGYTDQIQRVIDRSKQQLTENFANGMPEDSYSNRYQRKIIEIYHMAGEKVRLLPEYIEGWDLLLSVRVIDLFLFVFLSVIAAISCNEETQSEFLTILRATKNGREKTAVAKIIAGILSISGLVVLFYLEMIVICSLFGSFSGHGNAIQMISSFQMCPYAITIGEAVGYCLFTKIFVLSMVYLLFLVFSYQMNKYLGSLLIYLAFGGVAAFLYQYPYLNSNAHARVLNLFSAISPEMLLERYVGVNVFGDVIDAPIIIFVFYGIIGIVSAMIFFWSFGTQLIKRKHILRISNEKKFPYPLKATCFTQSSSKVIQYIKWSDNLVMWEWHKLWRSIWTVLTVMVLLFVRIYVLHYSYANEQSAEDAAYEIYMTELEGELTLDKQKYICDEREKINRYLAEYDEFEPANESVTYAEYRSVMINHRYAEIRDPVLKKIEVQALRIEQLVESGVEAWFVYDTGWNALLLQTFDWTIFAVLLLLYAPLYANENIGKNGTSGFRQIIRTTRYGRIKTYQAKFIASYLNTTVLYIVWLAIEFFVIFSNYRMSLSSAPVASFQLLEGFECEMTVVMYTVCFVIIRYFGVLMLTWITMFLSEVTHQTFLCLIFTSCLVLFPSAAHMLHVDWFANIDYIKVLCGTPILLENESGIVYIIICIILVLILGILAWRSWVGNKYSIKYKKIKENCYEIINHTIE